LNGGVAQQATMAPMASISSGPPQSSSSPASVAECPNCNALLEGPWCSKCGQKQSDLDPTWHDLLHDSIHEFLHLDGKIFRTARKLFLEPGELTAEFLRGRRARYIGALRLYLTFSVLFFVITALVPNPNPDAEDHNAPATASELATERVVTETFAKVLPKLVFILVPVFALLLKLAHRGLRRNYPQFLYFSLHFHAAVFGLLALVTPLQALQSEAWLHAAQACVLAGAFGYLVAGIKRVFGGSARMTFVRALAVSVGYLAVLTTTTAAVIIALLRWASSH
jgi:hypothetical protein